MTSEKNLKRFERLESSQPSDRATQETRTSKHFECLEVGEKKIEVSITDSVTAEEESSVETVYYILCPFCKAENLPEAQSCVRCHQPLTKRMEMAYQTKSVSLKKCSSCEFMNRVERKNCWNCGKEFLRGWGGKVRNDTDNVITLNIDGKEYKSSDEVLPMDIRILMQRIRREGYKKELIDDWALQRRLENELEKDKMENRIKSLQHQLIAQSRFRLVSLAVSIILFVIFLVSRGCR